MRQVSERTDQEARSLLQKAVRRGWVDAAESASAYLLERGDRAWLRGRLGVLLFEEAWSVAHLLRFPERGEDPIAFVRALTVLPKNKDAAGMGAIAHMVSERGRDHIRNSGALWPPAAVVEALQRPADFFAWAGKHAPGDDSARVIENAEVSYRRAGWPWDKAFAIAGAYLATRFPERLSRGNMGVTTLQDEPVDVRVAIDRHTLAGRNALAAVAREVDLKPSALSWASFFFWSGQVIGASQSEWWEAEMRVRIEGAGETVAKTREVWEIAKPQLLARLGEESDLLESRLGLKSAQVPGATSAGQLGLFG